MATRFLASGKGGVGKSLKGVMTAYGIAVEMCEELQAGPLPPGKDKVLVIDLDSQAAATRRLKVASRPGYTMAEVLDFDSPRTLRDIIVPCGWDDPICNGRVFVAPASTLLSTRDKESHLPGANRRLVKHILDVMDEYREILIDLPSGITHLMEIAAVISDKWIGVAQPEIDSINDLARVHHILTNEWKEREICSQLELDGVTVNLIDPNQNVKLHSDGLELLSMTYGDRRWPETDTKRMIRLAELNSYAVPPHQLTGLTTKEHNYILDKSVAIARRVMSNAGAK